MRNGSVDEELRGDEITVEGIVNAVYRNRTNGQGAVKGGVG
jgi:hypothetical protein